MDVKKTFIVDRTNKGIENLFFSPKEGFVTYISDALISSKDK